MVLLSISLISRQRFDDIRVTWNYCHISRRYDEQLCYNEKSIKTLATKKFYLCIPGSTMLRQDTRKYFPHAVPRSTLSAHHRHNHRLALIGTKLRIESNMDTREWQNHRSRIQKSLHQSNPHVEVDKDETHISIYNLFSTNNGLFILTRRHI